MLLLLEQLSAPRAHQQLLSSQMLLNFTNSEGVHVRERALKRIMVLSRLLANNPTLEVRSQAPSSQAVSPSLHTRAACSSPRRGLLPSELLWGSHGRHGPAKP